MKIGFIGLGKLGLPCALAMEKHGNHEIFGFEISDSTKKNILNKKVFYKEEGVNEYLGTSKIEICNSINEVMRKCETVFIAVQTPHEKEYEGVTELPATRKDFNYDHLVAVIKEIADVLNDNSTVNPAIVLISTVLPGTCENIVLPLLSKVKRPIKFAYNPYFIAMGTTIYDFLNPEFILIGSDSIEAKEDLKIVYSFLDAPIMFMEIAEAELTKVSYNTFIGLKLIFVNTLMEICDKLKINVDSVTGALSKANKRLLSSQYMTAGMGDGGGCHPRDQIAMSFLSKKLDLSSDLFEIVASTRDAQSRFLAGLISKYARETNLDISILGLAYKPNSNLIIGSPSLLLISQLEQMGHSVDRYDPHVNQNDIFPVHKKLFFIATKHDIFESIEVPKGSVVMDPWGYYSPTNFVEVIKIGRRGQ